MNRYKKLFGNTLVLMLGNFSSKILVFLMLPLYTACLSTEEYGTVDLMMTTVNLLYPILTLLASEIALRFTLDKDANKAKILTTCIKLHIVGFVVMLLFSSAFKLIPQIYEYRLIFFLYYFFGTLSNILMQFSKGCDAVKEYSFTAFIKTFVTIVLNLVFLLCFKMGMIGYMYAYISADIIACLFLFLKLKLYKYVDLFSRTDTSLLKSMLSYSIPMLPNSICWWINNSLDRYLLLFFVGASATGIYSAANKIPAIIITFSTIFINAWQISSVDDFGTEKNRLFFSEIYKKYSAFIICLSAIGIMFGKIITGILLDDKFVDADKSARVLMLAFVFHTMSAFLGTVYTSSKKTKTLFISTFLGAIVNLVFNILLIPKLGCIGAAIATAFAYMCVWISRLWASKKIVKLSIALRKDILCYALIILECALAITNMKYSQIILPILVAVIFALNYKEIKNIFNLRKIKNILFKK